MLCTASLRFQSAYFTIRLTALSTGLAPLTIPSKFQDQFQVRPYLTDHVLTQRKRRSVLIYHSPMGHMRLHLSHGSLTQVILPNQQYKNERVGRACLSGEDIPKPEAGEGYRWDANRSTANPSALARLVQ